VSLKYVEEIRCHIMELLELKFRRYACFKQELNFNFKSFKQENSREILTFRKKQHSGETFFNNTL
jgi:hypothetical protein